MKKTFFTLTIILLLGGCAVNQIPNMFQKEKVETKQENPKCEKDFTAVTITAYKEGKNYFADLKTIDGERKHLPLKVTNQNFKKRIYEECFISPAAWLMVTQPDRFKFFIDKNDIFQYKMNKK